MRKELSTWHTPSLAKDHWPPFDGHPSPAGRLEAERRDIFGGRDAERFVNIPVVIHISGVKSFDHTVQVNVDLNNPPTYGELIDKILAAAEGPLRRTFQEDDGDFTMVRRGLEKCMLGPECVYFVWYFAPPMHFEPNGHVTLGYGSSEATGLSPKEIGGYLHSAYAGKISFIFASMNIMRGARENGFGVLKQSRERKGKGRLDGIALGALCGELSGEKGKSTTPLKQRPPSKQASQTGSPRGDAVKTGGQESGGTGSTIDPEPHGDTKGGESGGSGDGDGEKKDKIEPIVPFWLLVVWLVLASYPFSR